jgi:hypothetical protein
MHDHRCFITVAGLGVLLLAGCSLEAPINDIVTNGGLGCSYSVTPENPPNDGILFVDHSPAERGGHLGHALVEYADGKILAFYPNCSAGSHNPEAFPMAGKGRGHSARGWMEFKRSLDGGETWSDP